jgi:hypothetical protein
MQKDYPQLTPIVLAILAEEEGYLILQRVREF